MINWAEGKGWVTAGGKRLEWAAWGAFDAGPVIVLLHEGLGCLALWRDFPERLSQATGLPVFAYSRANYGHSDAAELPFPVDYMTRHAVDVLPEVLDAIGAEHVILMGHSDGATIAAEYAGRVVDFRVRGLVLMAPHFFTEEMGLAQIRLAREAFAQGDMAEKMGKYHRDPAATFKGWNDGWLNPDFAAWDVSEVIDFLRVPALVIQGKDDQYGTLRQVDEVVSRSYAPVDVLVPDDCRHSPQFDQPEAVLGAVRAFTQRLLAHEAAQPERA
ncbi:alpha/beta fold hydrolase [Pararhodobacter zhoushanensis]|uniref:alpha/beta fold hydrolase n=1 Tax=Pararhodobacter zhoushanensis TaxID=2479545 RepID=UPI000F8C5BB2|nr:alpha/beta hydrolase [Pararhodobacter zhoushanensis]